MMVNVLLLLFSKDTGYSPLSRQLPYTPELIPMGRLIVAHLHLKGNSDKILIQYWRALLLVDHLYSFPLADALFVALHQTDAGEAVKKILTFPLFWLKDLKFFNIRQVFLYCCLRRLSNTISTF